MGGQQPNVVAAPRDPAPLERPAIAGPGAVGLVHDYLLALRGAERTFAVIADCWPDAPIYTLLYDPDGTENRFAGRSIRTSYLQRLRIRQRGFRRWLPLFGPAAARLSLGAHDLVVSSSSAFSHGVRPADGATHVCYCHSPFRYAWFESGAALAEVPALLRPAVRGALARVRRRDMRAAAAVTHYIANSELTRRRIQDFWDRDATVVHPPVEVERFHTAPPEDYLLVVSEMVRHKNVEVALEAAKRARQPIKVVGSGPDLRRLMRAYGDSAEFLGRVPDDRLTGLYARARAFVVPNVEEFGIAAVEAQAAGRPVIAVNAGGARETVVDGKTGILVDGGGAERLAEAMSADLEGFSPAEITRHASGFSKEAFRRKFLSEVARASRR